MEVSNQNVKILLYIILAFLFSIGIRMIWVYYFNDTASFFWNGQMMINTNDGYYFAEGARDILNGFHQPNDISPIHEPLSIITAWLAKILPFSFESIILYMPSFFGSLVVIPIVLIGKSLKNIELGFIAALLASIAWSYYNRTMIGYYDTDMLNIVFPTFILWAMIRSIQTEQFRYLFYLSLFEILYILWYPQGYAIEFAFFGLVLLYTLLFRARNEYLHKMLIIMLFSMLNLPLYIKVSIIIILFVLFKTIKEKFNIVLSILFLIGLVLFFLTGGVSPIWGSIKGYIIRDAVNEFGDSLVLHFFSVAQTVRESGKIPFEIFASRISGHVITFFISLFGFVWLCFRHPIMLLSLPMLGLGFLAYSGGLRFTIYAVPILALGISYLIVKLSDLINNKQLKYAFMMLLTFAILYPNIIHVIAYKTPTVFNNKEVSVIDFLRKNASREDYVVSWWDYGYLLRYYGDVKTLVDGGIHHGSDNFAPSFILTYPQQVAAKMARLEVEYTEAGYLDENNTDTTIFKMMKDYGYKNSNNFLASLDKIKLPKKTRDIFLFLPFRMTGIYTTVASFSHIDLMNGAMKRQPFLQSFINIKDDGKTMVLGRGISIDKAKGLVVAGRHKIPLKSFYVVEYGKDGKAKHSVKNIRSDGRLNLVFAKSYGTFYLMDNGTLDSTFVQLFFFENYDKNLYEPVFFNTYAKLYKLKN
ncbi:MAG: peptide transporter [Proteobacteria bacterium]|nr:MAG: peptide transporter [Pseudomonadota bacterium]